MARSASRELKNRGKSDKSRPLADPPRTADLCPTPSEVGMRRRAWAEREHLHPSTERRLIYSSALVRRSADSSLARNSRMSEPKVKRVRRPRQQGQEADPSLCSPFRSRSAI